MRVTVVGLGAVGLVTAAGLAHRGHDVVGLEADEGRLGSLHRREVPFFEPGLAELVTATLDNRHLKLTASVDAAVASAEIVVIAVGTHGGDGDWQTTTMARCLGEVVPRMADDAVLVIRSTLPPEFVAGLAARMTRLREEAGGAALPVLLNPEFTREGTAVADFLRPTRIVVGVAADPAGRGLSAVRRMYHRIEAPFLVVPAMEACLGKLAANLFLATRISFANELADICDALGADLGVVVGTMAPDPRIGGSFFRPGVGFGGSCLPSQAAMVSRLAAGLGVATPLLDAVTEVNGRQPHSFIERLESFLGDLRRTRIALLGLAFKPGTDDLRDAPSLGIARTLLDRGAAVVAYDPMPRARSGAAASVTGLAVAGSVEEALAEADAAGLVTEWPEFVELDWSELRPLMRRPIVVDGRNALSSDRLIAAGFAYAGFGRAGSARAGLAEAPPMPTPAGGSVTGVFGESIGTRLFLPRPAE